MDNKLRGGEYVIMNINHIKIMLIIVAALLFFNLFYHPISSVIAPEAVAESLAQDIGFGAREGSGIACSNDGKYVYATDGSSIYRSVDYGKRGTWEEVAR